MDFPRERRQIRIPANRPATAPRLVTYSLSTRLLVDEMGGYWLQQPLLVVIPELSTFQNKVHVLWNDFSYEIPTHTVKETVVVQFNTSLALFISGICIGKMEMGVTSVYLSVYLKSQPPTVTVE